MPDISKCLGQGCPIKESCWRYIAPSNKFWQAYGCFIYNSDTKSCDGYWTIEEKKDADK